MAYARMVLAALALAGCELLVPDSLPQYSCTSPTDSCPTGMACNLSTRQCVAITDGAPLPDVAQDNYVGDTGGMDVVNDDGPAETGLCRSDGCRCSGPTDCASQICADALTVTPALFALVGHGFCTQPCCTSTDCATGYVCFGTAAGGNYCVDPSLLGRSAPSTTNNAGGTSCSSDGQCRSGLCVGSLCQDTCCSTTGSGECTGSYSCRYETFPGRATVDQHYTSGCMTTGGSGGDGASCGGNNSCKSNWCIGTCLAACRDSAQCGSGHYCGYGLDTSSDVVATCSSGAGATALGGGCTNPSDCATFTCDATTKKCTDVCYTDADCNSVSGWRCRPEITTVPMGGSASLLLCGP